jgi:ATP-dependent RNA helicase DHX36
MEISELSMILESTSPFSDKSQFLILPMHSGIPSKDQRLVFQRPRQGVRKIVLSTNICEASVTIDDVAFVIDTGRAKEKSYDPHLNTSTLQPIWISQASAKQRKGRAGRTKAGVCFHLFSRRRHASFREFLESEMIRTSLEEICLQSKKLNLCPGGIDDDDGIPSFLSRALTPPHPKAVLNAITDLVRLGAMEVDTNELTTLGHCLASLSVEPKVGKMVIWSYILGCSKDAASIAVAMGYKTPFVIPPPSMRKYADEAKIKLSEASESDQVLILNVLNKLDQVNKRGNKNSFRQDCRRSFINVGTLEMISSIRKNISTELESIGYPPPNIMNTWYNRNGNGNSLFSLQASVVAGLYPNVAVREEGEVNFRTMANQKAKMHISSVNSCKGMPLSRKSTELEFVAFGELVKGISTYTINQTTHLPSVLPILLLCGDFRIRTLVSKEDDTRYSVITIDEWISFRCEYKIGSALAVLRSRLNTIFFHFVSSSKHSWEDFNDDEKNTLAVFDTVSRSSFRTSSR